MANNVNTLQAELDRYARLFETIERSPLTHEQRVAAVTMARRNLLIAAAGSGKTSSMVGKVAYALCSGQCTADEILVLAFNRKAALELDERLRRALAPYVPVGTSVAASTLHALGLDIVTRVKGCRPQVIDAESRLLSRVLAQLVNEDVDFAERWLLFRIFYHVPVRHPDQFATRKQWKAFVRQHGTFRDRGYGFTTLRDELVPTQFEQAVANWLYLFDLDYVYTPLRRGFNWRRWVAGRMNDPLSGQTGFLLRASNRYIVCVTRSAMKVQPHPNNIYLNIDLFRNGTVFNYLRERLDRGDAVLKPGRMSSILSPLGYRLTPGQTDFLARFIRIARLDGMHPDQLMARAQRSADPVRTSMHAPMLARLLCAYSATLEAENTIDFEGMLHRAADFLDQARHKHAYTLILVDEFQDTSKAGLRLIQSLLAQNDACKLFAVGDDWQSIYRFAGAVPDVLGRFEHYFGASVVNHLTATFRFDQSIADAARTFIQVNPVQLRKHVRARAACTKPSVVLGYYTATPHMFVLCETCLQDSVATFISDAGGQENTSERMMSVYVLGRYQHQRPPDLHRWQQHFPQLDIQYQTVHSAKGLEADIVIVLGLEVGRYGFPAQRPDDPLISLVMPAVECFPDAEERRLFYVALTRSRYRVYLLADLHRPSSFVTELIGLVKSECQVGSTAHRIEGKSVVAKRYRAWPELHRLC